MIDAPALDILVSLSRVCRRDRRELRFEHVRDDLAPVFRWAGLDVASPDGPEPPESHGARRGL
jgi:hypothetical protein